MLNINVGVLGHIDSGKTSLVKALSTSLSTAALDKHPQSQQRGITLDLGFSAFTLPAPPQLLPHISSDQGSSISSAEADEKIVQFTLVDCPGHASLIRTIIGGAQIIDMILLVVDANKGIQTQTAECIVLGEITTDSMIVVLNKVDSLQAEDREVRLQRVTNRIRKLLSTTKFKDAPIIATSAAVGGEKVAALKGPSKVSSSTCEGIEELLQLITRTVKVPNRRFDAPFYFAIDHCFPVKGHGTVLTGTVLCGRISVNGQIELPHLKLQRKVKSMQMFRKPVKAAQQGDRVGICVTNLDASAVERAIAAAPGTVPLLHSALCIVKKVRFFKLPCKSNAKCHISIGHNTVVANVVFFGSRELQKCSAANVILSEGKDPGSSQETQENNQPTLNATYMHGFPCIDYPFPTDSSVIAADDADFEFQHEIEGNEHLQGHAERSSYGSEPIQWALLQFQQPVYCPIGSLVIGSRLDTDTTGHPTGSIDGSTQCRLAFFGPVKHALQNGEQDLSKLRVFNWKLKLCEVFLLTDVDVDPNEGKSKKRQTNGLPSSRGKVEQRRALCREAVVWKLTSSGASVQPFLGLKVETKTGVLGTITSAYGADGKCRVKFPQPGVLIDVGDKLAFRFKRYLYDSTKTMVQTGLEELMQRSPTAATMSVATPPLEPVAVANKAVQSTELSCKVRQKILEERKLSSVDESIDPQPEADYVGLNMNVLHPPRPASLTPHDLDTSQFHQQPLPPQREDKNPVVSLENHAGVIATTATTTAAVDRTAVERTGTIDVLKEPFPNNNQLFQQVIVSGAFTMEENVRSYSGCAVVGPAGEEGQVAAPFGKLGKCKVRFERGTAGPVGSTVKIIIANTESK